MLLNGFFRVEANNPDLPPEEWTLIEEKTTAGSYSKTLSWGRYKIIISGAGGGGAACGWNSPHGTRYAEDGYAGSESTCPIFSVYKNKTSTISATIGEGGGGGYAHVEHTHTNQGGAGGAGFNNGYAGDNEMYIYPISAQIEASASGGGGGGSTHVYIPNLSPHHYIVPGGNGGNARQSNYGIWGYGGQGGAYGTTTGTGAPGGKGSSSLTNNQLVGGSGSDGYIRIYKSNLYPEDVQ